jgi:large subunit ribosomal protein L21
MIAVVNIDGRQLKVEKNQEFYIDRISGKKGDKLVLDAVSLLQNGDKITIGSPIIDGANVTVSILEHIKDKKIIVFKKKRRKGYKVKNGHRQMLTKIKIDEISVSKKKKSVKTEEVDTSTKTAKKTPAKKTTAKKTPAKKTTAKKTTAKKAPAKKTTKK